MTPEEFGDKLTPEAVAELRLDLLQRGVLIIEGNVKQRTPVRTGTLRRGWTSRVESAAERGVVGNPLRYARPVERRRQMAAKGLKDSQGQIDRMCGEAGEAFLAGLAS